MFHIMFIFGFYFACFKTDIVHQLFRHADCESFSVMIISVPVACIKYDWVMYKKNYLLSPV